MYTTLDAEQTIATIERLERRIRERFPQAGLSKVCADLCEIARASKRRSESIARPNIGLRIIVGLIIFGALWALGYSVVLLEFESTRIHAPELVQVVDAIMNEIVLVGGAMFFLVTVETRVKRARALAALHELRSLAHVIDMHQLTKDPRHDARLLLDTASSPKRVLRGAELGRYLDYCTEMLSLTGKIAALYAQTLNDAVVLGAVNEIETLTTSLSRKIWQKIMILRSAPGVSGTT